MKVNFRREATYLCADVAFANLGLAVWSGKRFIYLDCISTIPLAKKHNTYVVDDNVRRCRELARGMATIIGRFSPVACFAELPPGGGRSMKPVAAMAMSTAVVSSVAEVLGVPLYPIQPQEVKRVVTGKNSATKQQVIKYVLKTFGDMKTADNRLLSKRGDAEHIADAMALISVAKRSFKQLFTNVRTT